MVRKRFAFLVVAMLSSTSISAACASESKSEHLRAEGLVQFSKKHYSQALAKFATALSHCSTPAERAVLNADLADACLALGKTSDADKHFAAAVADKNSAPSYVMLEYAAFKRKSGKEKHAMPADAENVNMQPIGTATMLADGTIKLQLRAVGPGYTHGDAVLTYKPSDPKYKSVLSHVGPLQPGETKQVLPFPD